MITACASRSLPRAIGSRKLLGAFISSSTKDPRTSATIRERQPMDYVWLGKTGVKVSKLGFGTMLFGTDADEHASAALYAKARDGGINLFDCADVYANGRSEEILGRFVAPHRNEIVLTSKAYFPTSSDPNARGT